MQCVCGAFWAAAGCGQPQPQRPHSNKFLRTGSSAMPHSTSQKLTRCGILRLSRLTLREALAERQILVRSKFAFLLKEHTQNQTMSGGGNWFEKSIFSGRI